jgi:predicted  nucleic acid-binding Zn-ribbon protein
VRLLKAYEKIRSSYRNGLAVVTVERDSCGGCFNKIPPQMQLEISLRKKVLACEHCGRILVDNEIAGIKEEVA